MKISLEEAFAVYRLSGEKEDLELVVRAGRKLVCHFVRLFSGGEVEDDLVQAGMEGLLKAVKRFDPEVGAGFATYAGHCILGEVRHYFRKEASYYRPGCVADLQSKVEKVTEERLKRTGEPPSIKEIACVLNVRESGVVQVMRAGLVSLDEINLKEIRNLKYESFKLPIEDKIMLEQAINKLSEFQRKVVRLLFYRGMTQVEAAKELGVNQRKVSRVLHKSLEKMAENMKETG